MHKPRRRHPKLTQAQLRDREKTRSLERIADALEALVIAANSIATAMGIQQLREEIGGRRTK